MVTLITDKTRADDRLDKATDGLDLTDAERRVLEWCKRFDAHTVNHIASVVEKARQS